MSNTATTDHVLPTRTLSHGDFVMFDRTGTVEQVMGTPQPGMNGTKFRLTGNTPGGDGYYAPTLNGRIVGYNDHVTTPGGRGVVVGFHKSIGRILVQLPGVNGATAVKYSDITR